MNQRQQLILLRRQLIPLLTQLRHGLTCRGQFLQQPIDLRGRLILRLTCLLEGGRGGLQLFCQRGHLAIPFDRGGIDQVLQFNLFLQGGVDFAFTGEEFLIHLEEFRFSGLEALLQFGALGVKPLEPLVHLADLAVEATGGWSRRHGGTHGGGWGRRGIGERGAGFIHIGQQLGSSRGAAYSRSFFAPRPFFLAGLLHVPAHQIAAVIHHARLPVGIPTGHRIKDFVRFFVFKIRPGIIPLALELFRLLHHHKSFKINPFHII